MRRGPCRPSRARRRLYVVGEGAHEQAASCRTPQHHVLCAAIAAAALDATVRSALIQPSRRVRYLSVPALACLTEV